MTLNFNQIATIACGAAYCSQEPDGVILHRFTKEQEELYRSYNDDFYNKTFASAGQKLSFETDGESLVLQVLTNAASSRSFFSYDLCVDGVYQESLDNFSEGEVPTVYAAMQKELGVFRKKFELGKGVKRVDIYLPWSVSTKIQELTIEGATFFSRPYRFKKLLAFGDSITHGYDALRPSNHYASMLAEKFNAELFNKGIGGEVFYPALAKTKEPFTPDFITVAYGTNDWSCRKEKDYRENCRAFYENLASTYPNTKIFAITPIWRMDYQTRKGDFGDFLKVADAIEEETAHLKNVVVFRGYDFVSKTAQAFGDLVIHPNDEGFKEYYDSLYEAMKPYIKGQTQSADKYDIVIQGGQSNAEGCGHGPTQKEYIPTGDVLYLDAEKVMDDSDDLAMTIKVAEERFTEGRHFADFSLSFAEQYKQKGYLKDGRKLLIIRSAVGGTGFKQGLWGKSAPLYLRMLKMTEYALSLNPENRVVAFLWHQGERDAVDKNDPKAYKSELKACVETVRERFGDMPFITADFVNEWKSKNIGICKPIIDTIKEVVAEVGNSAFVETADLPSNNQTLQNGDDVHYCRNSLRLLGERYFSAFETLVK